VPAARVASAPGSLAHDSGDWSRSSLSALRSVAPGAGLAMPDLLTFGRRDGRAGENAGALPSGFGGHEQIRPATGSLAGTLPAGPGPRSTGGAPTGTTTTGAALRRRAHATGAASRPGLGLLNPHLTRHHEHGAGPASTPSSTTSSTTAGAAPATARDAGTSGSAPAGTPAAASGRLGGTPQPPAALRRTPASTAPIPGSPTPGSPAGRPPAGPFAPPVPTVAPGGDAAALRAFLHASTHAGQPAGTPAGPHADTAAGTPAGGAPALRRRTGTAPRPGEPGGRQTDSTQSGATASWLEQSTTREGAMSSPGPAGRPRPPVLPLPPAGSASGAAGAAPVRRTPHSPSGPRSALFERNAHLFTPDQAAPADPGAPAQPDSSAARPAGAPGAPGAVDAAALATVTYSAPAPGGPPVPESGSMDPQQMDEVIAAVVERIEQRVIDELERRGRRSGRGGF
jgi:hypothetical protein